ncbi:hypothetical protein KCU71_g3286, partial [Aureobasidium melanogenum]
MRTMYNIAAYLRGSLSLALLFLYLSPVQGLLHSTGVNFDQDAMDNLFVVYTSRVILQDKTTTLYPTGGHLLALAYQAYDDMIKSCKFNNLQKDCPGAITVFAYEKEIHFGSSVKNFRGIEGNTNPQPFYHAFIYEKNVQGFDRSRRGTVARVRQAMIQCQTQQSQTVIDYRQHGRSARCGEFNAVLTYLLTRDDPESVDFGGDPDNPARILTVGRRGDNRDVMPQFFKPCSKIPTGPSTYGCRNWVARLGIEHPTPGRSISIPDPGSQVQNIKLCELSIDESMRVAGSGGGLDADSQSSSEFGSGIDEDDLMDVGMDNDGAPDFGEGTDDDDSMNDNSSDFGGGIDDDDLMNMDPTKRGLV